MKGKYPLSIYEQPEVLYKFKIFNGFPWSEVLSSLLIHYFEKVVRLCWK